MKLILFFIRSAWKLPKTLAAKVRGLFKNEQNNLLIEDYENYLI